MHMYEFLRQLPALQANSNLQAHFLSTPGKNVAMLPNWDIFMIYGETFAKG